MDNFKALEEIEKSTGYEIALITTFNIDVEFFERYIISKLYSNGIRKIALIVDARELNKGITEIRKPSVLLGKKYSVNPVSITGAYHPKMILLLAQDKAKLIIASANCTYSGYITNNEIFNAFEVNSNDLHFLPLIQAAARFLLKSYEMSYGLDDELISEVQSISYLNQTNQSGSEEAVLLHNMDTGILEQAARLMSDVKSIDIAVPFYDNDLSALSIVRERFPNATLNVYLQNHKSRFNTIKSAGIKGLALKVFDGFKSPNSRYFYHGKVIRFKSPKESWVLYGSANCTQAALLKTPDQGGNVECNVIERGRANEFDYYFDNIILEKDADVECNLLDITGFTNEEKYHYKYGQIDGDGSIRLVIGCLSDPQGLIVRHEESVVTFKYHPGERHIICTLKATDLSYVSDLLTLTLEDGENKYEIICWIQNNAEIELSRTADSPNRTLKVYEYPQYNEFYENLISLRKYLALCVSEHQRREELSVLFGQNKKAEVDKEDSEEAPEGIIEYVIPPRIPTSEERQEFENYQTARSLSLSFLKRLLSSESSNVTQRNNTEDKTKTGDRNRKDDSQEKPLDNEEEQKIIRFIKSTVNDVLNERYIEIASTEEYIKAIAFVCYAFSYIPEGRTSGLFDLNYAITARNLLMLAVADKKDEITEDQAKILLEFYVVNHYLEHRLCKNSDEFEPYIADSIKALNKRFHIRESLNRYISDKTVDSIGEALEVFVVKKNLSDSISGIRPTVKEVIRYVEDSIGYKTKEQLEALNYKNLGETALIGISKGKYYVIGQSDSAILWLGENDWLIQEIEKHCAHYHDAVDSVLVDVSNNCMGTKGDPIKSIIIEKVIGNSYIQRTITRKSGKKEPYDTGIKSFYGSSKKKAITEPAVELVLRAGDTIKHVKWGTCSVLSVADDKIELLLPDGTTKKAGKDMLWKFIKK